MHSHRWKAGTAMGVMVGLVAGSLAMAPVSSSAEDEEAGNNLAFPVLWSEEGYQLDPPGEMGETLVSGTTMSCSEESGIDAQAAIQKDPGNLWQADNETVPENFVTSLDWGDNIEVKDWRVGQVVRVETALYAAVDPTMTGYEMCHVSGKGTDEVWGAIVSTGNGGGPEEPDPEVTEEGSTPADEPTAPEASAKPDTTGKPDDAGKPDDTGKPDVPAESDPSAEVVEPAAEDNGSSRSLTEYESAEAMVYSAGARLTIQRVDDPANATWDATEHRWVGSGVADPVFNGAIHEKDSEGPGSYGAEINVSGKLVYGFVWRTDDLFEGEYRITFSLDGTNGEFPGTGTSLENAELRVSEEETAGDELAIRSATVQNHGGGDSGHGGSGGEGGEGEGNTAVILGEQNLSYIDVGLEEGEEPPPNPEPTPEPTVPPAPPTGDAGTSAPSGSTGGTASDPSAVDPGAGQPDASVPVGPASPIQVLPRMRQTAQIGAPSSRKVKVRTRLMLTDEPVYTDWGVTVRWRVTKRSEDNCTIRNRKGEQTVKFTKRGRCAVVAWAPSPNPLFVAPFKEKRIYKVRNSL